MNTIVKELTATDRPLKDMLSADLRIMSSSLQSAISDAKMCGLDALAAKLEALRAPIVAEYNDPERANADGRGSVNPRGPRSPYSSSENR